MDKVKDWLNSTGKDYDTGVQLLLLHSNRAEIKHIFKHGQQTNFKRARLAVELHAIFQAWCQPSAPAQALERLERKNNAITSSRGWPDPMSEYIAALHFQWKPLYGEMLSLQHRVYEVALAAEKNNDASGRARANEMAFRILDLDSEIDRIYDKRDYYLQHGSEIYSREVEVVTDPIKLALEYKNVQRYIRDYNVKLKSNPANEAWIAKRDAFIKRLDELKTILKIQ